MGTRYSLALLAIGAVGIFVSLVAQDAIGAAMAGISVGIGATGFVLTDPKESPNAK